MQRLEGTWRCSSGLSPMAAPGVGPVLMQQEEAIWRCCSGHTPTAAPGTRIPVLGQQKVGSRRWALEMLQWARANGCPWDESTCSDAALGGHMAVLQWAHANGCLWNEDICGNLARGGYLAMLQCPE
jgi:hypothetical protein